MAQDGQRGGRGGRNQPSPASLHGGRLLGGRRLSGRPGAGVARTCRGGAEARTAFDGGAGEAAAVSSNTKQRIRAFMSASRLAWPGVDGLQTTRGLWGIRGCALGGVYETLLPHRAGGWVPCFFAASKTSIIDAIIRRDRYRTAQPKPEREPARFQNQHRNRYEGSSARSFREHSSSFSEHDVFRGAG